MTRRLIVIEPGLAAVRPGAELQTGIGHWVEAIERFCGAWRGETVLIGNTVVGSINGVDRVRTLSKRLVDQARPLHQKILTRSVMALDPLLSKRLGPRIVRADWEQGASQELIYTVAQELADNADSTIFIPTTIPIVIETLIAGLPALLRASGPRHLVRIRPLFQSQWHEHRGSSPSYFGHQLQRWLARGAGADIKFGIEVDVMVEKYRAWAGDAVQWVPWPIATQHNALERSLPTAAPKIFIYAARKEQGGRSILSVVQSLADALDGNLRLVIRGGKENRGDEERIRAQYPYVDCTFIRTSVPPQELYSLASGSVAAVLPYDVRRYKGRSSSLMWGALDLNLPIIAPAGTGYGDDAARAEIGYAYENIREIPALVQRAIHEAGDLHAAIARFQARRTAAVASYLGT